MAHSHLSDPTHLSRLLTIMCLAFLWMIYRDVEVRQRDWQGVIHRKAICDLTLLLLRPSGWNAVCSKARPS